MLKFLKSAWLVLMLVILNLSFNASQCRCKATCYKITQIRFQPLDNSGADTLQPKLNNIPAKAFALVLQFKTVSMGTCFRKPFALINQAYAVDCGPSAIVRDTVDNYTLYSTTNFDPSHPAGKDLTDLFVVSPSPNLYSDLMYASALTHVYYLKSLPDSVRTYRFIFRLKLNHNQTLTDTTEPIKLTL